MKFYLLLTWGWGTMQQNTWQRLSLSWCFSQTLHVFSYAFTSNILTFCISRVCILCEALWKRSWKKRLFSVMEVKFLMEFWFGLLALVPLSLWNLLIFQSARVEGALHTSRSSGSEFSAICNVWHTTSFDNWWWFRIGVDQWLRVPSVEDVFALGDCAGFLEQTGRKVLPALAQVRFIHFNNKTLDL